MSQIVIGTAGHIDHGKTSLVKALTGTDTDQLNEEKQRGMTIDLGFAYLNENFTIACSRNAIQILELQKEGKNKTTTEEFLRGNKLKTGITLA